ncbi:MAG: helix-turn-helix transcriptional regulator [Methylophilaceae bacterium]|nr:helix-turn-helix transcriptional regulator [Methylophilaceae bacterium]
MSIAKRLEDERKRLGKTQEEWAHLTGVHRNTQIKYERGIVTPNADYFALISTNGADVNYIITGEKSAKSFFVDNKGEVIVRPAVELERECAIAYNSVLALEAALVVMGRNLNPHQKASCVRMLFRLSWPHGAIDKPMIDDVISLAMPHDDEK